MTTASTNASTQTESPPATELVCWKVWGGNGQADVAVSIPGLRGQLYSRPCGSERGGDLYYLSACGSGALARMCIADVTGHGESVATFSGWLEEVFGKHIHRASPAVVLREVNRRAADRGLEVMSTAVCLSYNSLNGHLAFCNAGHPHVRLCRAGERNWQSLSVPEISAGQLDNLPLAVVSGAGYTIGRQ
jgi:phosphoserine phosphatase RsbU/P